MGKLGALRSLGRVNWTKGYSIKKKRGTDEDTKIKKSGLASAKSGGTEEGGRGKPVSSYYEARVANPLTIKGKNSLTLLGATILQTEKQADEPKNPYQSSLPVYWPAVDFSSQTTISAGD